MEIAAHHNQTGEILVDQYAPRLTSYNKLAIVYEQAFLKIGLALLALLPGGLISVMPITSKDRWVTLLVTFDDAVSGGHPILGLTKLSSERFTRQKKVRGSKQNM